MLDEGMNMMFWDHFGVRLTLFLKKKSLLETLVEKTPFTDVQQDMLTLFAKR